MPTTKIIHPYTLFDSSEVDVLIQQFSDNVTCIVEMCSNTEPALLFYIKYFYLYHFYIQRCSQDDKMKNNMIEH